MRHVGIGTLGLLVEPMIAEIVLLIMLIDFAKHFARDTNGYDIVRDVLGNDAAGADDGILADGDTRHDNYVGTQPGTILDGDRE